MTVNELKERLNELAWNEQMDFEMSERSPVTPTADMEETERTMRELAQKITPSLLDMLEQDEGYIVWSLRLSPYVSGDLPSRRGQRFLHHPDGQVQYWAAEIIRRHK